jgi:hypothetical protein
MSASRYAVMMLRFAETAEPMQRNRRHQGQRSWMSA